jgi:hexosaminidase
MRIEDYPVFEVERNAYSIAARHFMDKEFVMRYIDLLALHKMNVLHWHITEDQGWRLAIDKHPRLTDVGAFRTLKDGTTYGGYYSKEDVKEIVAYANQRHVEIVPEIELPGHCQAALAAYPKLSCTGDTIPVQSDWGVFKDIYCAGNDSVFFFLEDVLIEVMELFPSKYIHIGGDEVPTFRWENCSKCQARIRDHNLNDEHELQTYFVNRIAKFLKQNNKITIGWDEISEGNLSNDVVVQLWRDANYAIKASQKGHSLIMSPTSHCYFDYDLDAIDMQKVYEFDLTLNNQIARNLILGGECNMWSERAPQDLVDSKVFPRVLAMSEVLWYGGKKNYSAFYDRVQKHYVLLDKLAVNYGYEAVPISIKVKEKNKQFKVELYSSTPNVEIEYSFDNSKWLSYQKPLIVDRTTQVKARGFKNKKPYGSLNANLFLCKSTFKKVEYINLFSDNYSANSIYTLTDGQVGSNNNFRDGKWQGFYGNDLEVIVDLKEIQQINAISLGFFQYNLSWILLPKKIDIFISENGEDFSIHKQINNEISPQREGKFRHLFNVDTNIKTRFVKIKARNFGVLPDWHPAAGANSWLFVDEILIQ